MWQATVQPSYPINTRQDKQTHTCVSANTGVCLWTWEAEGEPDQETDETDFQSYGKPEISFKAMRR